MGVAFAHLLGIPVVAHAFPICAKQRAKERNGDDKTEDDVADIFPHPVKRKIKKLIQKRGELRVVGQECYDDGGGNGGNAKTKQSPADAAHHAPAVFSLFQPNGKGGEDVVAGREGNHKHGVPNVGKNAVGEQIFSRKTARGIEKAEEQNDQNGKQKTTYDVVAAREKSHGEDRGSGGENGNGGCHPHL